MGRNAVVQMPSSHTHIHTAPHSRLDSARHNVLDIWYAALIASANTPSDYCETAAAEAAMAFRAGTSTPAKSKNENRKFSDVALTTFTGTGDCNYR